MIKRAAPLFILLFFGFAALPDWGWTAEGRLNGAFVWPGWNPNWTQQRWTDELAMMREIGMNTIIVAYTVNETTAVYPTNVAGLTPTGSDPVGKILTAADTGGMEVYLGLVLQNAWWSQTDQTYLENLATLSNSVADDLYSQYGSHVALKGFYLPQEIDNCRWADETSRQRLVNALLKPVSDHIKTLDPNLVFCEAPFYNPTCQQPADYEQWWIATLNDTPNFDLVIPQDGIGANPSAIDFTVVQNYFTALGNACDTTSRTLWSDLEVFEKVGVADPPPTMDRILTQIVTESPLVQHIVVWEWDYIAPHHSVRALDFYDNYKRYLAGLGSLANVSNAKSYTVSPAASPSYPDSGGELADDTAPYDFGAAVGWQNDTNVSIVLDLGSTVSNLYNFRAWFLRNDSAAVQLPSQVVVSVSSNGTDYTPVGPLDPIAQDDGEANPYQIVLSTPVSGRYVKFDATTNGASWLMCNEVSAYAQSAEPTLISLGKPYTFEPSASSSYPDSGGELSDGNTSFTWESQVGWNALGSDVVVTLDLKGRYTIQRIEAYFMRSDVSSVQLPDTVNASVSEDGSTFASTGSLIRQTNQDEAINTYSLDTSTTGSFVRITISPPPGWLMLTEIKVYGTPAPVSQVTGWTFF